MAWRRKFFSGFQVDGLYPKAKRNAICRDGYPDLSKATPSKFLLLIMKALYMGRDHRPCAKQGHAIQAADGADRRHGMHVMTSSGRRFAAIGALMIDPWKTS